MGADKPAWTPLRRLTEIAADSYYFAMRLARRTCLPASIPSRWTRFLPGYGCNWGVSSPVGAADVYDGYLSSREAGWPRGLTLMEIGVGATNSSAYALAARGAAHCYAFEPFVALEREPDTAALAACARLHGIGAERITDSVSRIGDTGGLRSGSIDCILSNSVLEHVDDLDALVIEMRRVLRPGGIMLHMVDYRDHFFTFPYHMLLWSDRVWRRFLDPGDLPRWRIGDHLAAFRRHGFVTDVLAEQAIKGAFRKVRHRVHPCFSQRDERDLRTSQAVLLSTACAA